MDFGYVSWQASRWHSAALLTPRSLALNLVDSEPQSDDIRFWVLQGVAQTAYLSGFLCWWLRTVAARCVLGGVNGGVKRYGAQWCIRLCIACYYTSRIFMHIL